MPWYRRVVIRSIGGFERVEFHMIGARRGLPPVEGIPCKQCGGERLVRFGSYNGRQRYQCRDCGSTQMHGDALPHGKVDIKVIGSALYGFYEGHSLNAIRRQLRQDYDLYPSDSTLYRWVAKFTPIAVKALNQLRAKGEERWVADEMMVRVEGRQTWLWDVMGAESRYLYGSRLSVTRTLRDAQAVFKLANERAQRPPKVITTDRLASYIEGIERVFGASSRHVQSQGMRAEVNNNLSERLQGTIRQRTKVMRGMQDRGTASLILDGFRVHYNCFREHEGLGGRTPAEAAGIRFPFKNWTEVVRNG